MWEIPSLSLRYVNCAYQLHFKKKKERTKKKKLGEEKERENGASTFTLSVVTSPSNINFLASSFPVYARTCKAMNVI